MGRVFKRLAMSHLDHTTASATETKLLRVKDIFLDYFRDLNWDKDGKDELDKLVKKLLRCVTARARVINDIILTGEQRRT